MRFAVFLFHSVLCLYVILCSFVVFVPPYAPLVVALRDTYLLILSCWLFEFLCCSEELLSLMCSIDSPAGDKTS